MFLKTTTYIYTETHKDTDTDRHAHRQRKTHSHTQNRQIDTHTLTLTDRQTYRQAPTYTQTKTHIQKHTHKHTHIPRQHWFINQRIQRHETAICNAGWPITMLHSSLFPSRLKHSPPWWLGTTSTSNMITAAAAQTARRSHFLPVRLRVICHGVRRPELSITDVRGRITWRDAASEKHRTQRCLLWSVCFMIVGLECLSALYAFGVLTGWYYLRATGDRRR